jgi:spoIIIJ-associated protein
MDAIEREGKTVDEALEAALRELGLRREQAQIDVLREPSAGFLGMGAKAARVRVARKDAASQVAPDTARACSETRELLKQLLSTMGFGCRLGEPSWDPVQERVRCALEGPDTDRLLAFDGRALEALQFLATLIVGRRLGAPVAVQVDADGYWDKREQEILAQAKRGLDEVLSTGKPSRLAPMDSSMRRLVHRSLMSHPEVETSSEGEGSWRKIVIRPRKR